MLSGSSSEPGTAVPSARLGCQAWFLRALSDVFLARVEKLILIRQDSLMQVFREWLSLNVVCGAEVVRTGQRLSS